MQQETYVKLNMRYQKQKEQWRLLKDWVIEQLAETGDIIYKEILEQIQYLEETY